MKIVKTLFCALFLLSYILHTALALQCISCLQGYHDVTPCSKTLPQDMIEVCEGPNPECFQAIEWFQNGAIQWVRRGCSSNNGTGGYCKHYPYKKTGVLKKCKTCKKDNCNSDVIYEPLSQQCS